MRIEGNLLGGEFAEIEIADGHVRALRTIATADASQPFLSPGFIDIQINGFAGIDFSSPDLTPEAAISVLPALWKTGVTTICPTLITNTRDRLIANFRTLERARQLDLHFARAVPCYHLEGPYISPGPSQGAHDASVMRPPDWDEFCALQEAADDRIGIVTLAPELPGAPEFIERARRKGVVVAISHTDGAPVDVYRAADAGATLATHLGNGCPRLIDRHRAPLWAEIVEDRLHASLICDGFHLTPEMVKIIVRVKGLRRTILVTDAVQVAGMPPGRSTLGGIAIELEESGRVVRIGADSLAGSSLSMNRAVVVFRDFASVSLDDAVTAATANPAHLIKRQGVCSELLPGQPANLIAFSPGEQNLKVHSVWLHGEQVFSGN